MKRLMITLGLALGMAGLVACSSAPKGATDALDKQIRADVSQGFSGVVLVSQGGTTLLADGFGTISGVTVKRSDLFWIASAGKQFTAAAIFLCAERGLLSLSDPIARFFPDAPKDKRAITVRQLLSHTTGLGQSYASEGKPDRNSAVHAMLAEALIDPPGKAFHYSNSNYQLLAAIVETVTGQDYRAFVTREFFDRFDLTQTGLSDGTNASSVLAGPSPMPGRLIHPGWGAEGYFSTADDLAKWVRLLRDGKVLKPASVAQMFAPAATIQEGETALGWFVGRTAKNAVRYFVRGNEDWGPNAVMYVYPDTDTLIVVLTHAGNKDDDTSWSRAVLADLEVALGL